MMAQHLTNIESVHYVDRLEQACHITLLLTAKVSAYFTSLQILSIEHAVTNKKEAVTSA